MSAVLWIGGLLWVALSFYIAWRVHCVESEKRRRIRNGECDDEL